MAGPTKPPGSCQVSAVAAGTEGHVEVAAAPSLLLLPPHKDLTQRWSSAGSRRWPCSLFSAGPSAALKTSSLCSLLPDDVFPGQMNKLIAFSPQSKQLRACPGTRAACLPAATAAGGEVVSLLHGGRFLLNVPSPRSWRNQIAPEEAARPLSLATTATAKPAPGQPLELS